MKSSPPVCPVPTEQQPIVEYQDMRESWYYSWGTRNLRGYVQPLVVLWLLSWLVVGPVAATSFPPGRALAQFLLSGGAGAWVLPGLALVQLYIGWQHVGNRLGQQQVPYEESGWYDGQIWVKPDDVLNRDRIIVEYQVQPILSRIRRTLGIMAGFLAVEMLVWQLGL